MGRASLALIGAGLIAAAGGTFAAESQGVIARCGESKGQGYFFRDAFYNPNGPNWAEDGITNGKIILVHLGDEWDIQFDDSLGANSYRQEGATVMPLNDGSGPFLTIGAFTGTYTDIYTFDMSGGEVVWTSAKSGTPIKKVAIYRSSCSFTAR